VRAVEWAVIGVAVVIVVEMIADDMIAGHMSVVAAGVVFSFSSPITKYLLLLNIKRRKAG